MSKFYILLLLFIAPSMAAMRAPHSIRNQHTYQTALVNHQQQANQTRFYNQLPVMTAADEKMKKMVDEMKTIEQLADIKGELVTARKNLANEKTFCDDLDEYTLDNLANKFHSFFKSDIIALARSINSDGSKTWLKKIGEKP